MRSELKTSLVSMNTKAETLADEQRLLCQTNKALSKKAVRLHRLSGRLSPMNKSRLLAP